jgi:hypothetical protein
MQAIAALLETDSPTGLVLSQLPGALLTVQAQLFCTHSSAHNYFPQALTAGLLVNTRSKQS